VYCEAKGFEGRYKIEKDVPISSAELKATEIATNFIFQQDEQKAAILTDSRTACQILIKALEGNRHNKIAIMRILNVRSPLILQFLIVFRVIVFLNLK
jgi:hypothetical protein